MRINKEIRDVLLNRFLISLGILLLIRIGTFLPVPGINHSELAFYLERHAVAKNLIELPLTKSLSIPHNVVGQFGACKVIMRPSIEGSGVIAGGAVRIVLEVAGVKNVIAKQLGSNNLLNNARASIHALQNLTTKSQVAKKRDLNFV